MLFAMADNKLQRTINSNPNPYPVDVATAADTSFTVSPGTTLQVIRKTDGVDSVLTLPTIANDGDILTVLMLQRAGLGNYTVLCLQGTVTFAAANQVATFRYQSATGIGWTLIADPYGATVA